MNIVKYPDPILTERIEEFDFVNPSVDPVQLEVDMLEFMYANDGIGLSANQIGERVRVFVMGNKNYPEQGPAFFNPEVIANTDDVIDLEE